MNTERRVKTTIRMTEAQRADIESAARECRMTVNDYALRSMLARSGDDAFFERVKALLEVKFIAIAADHSAHAEQLCEVAEQQRDLAQQQANYLKVTVNLINKWLQKCVRGTDKE